MAITRIGIICVLIFLSTCRCFAETEDEFGQRFLKMQNEGMELLEKHKLKEAEDKFKTLVEMGRKTPGPQQAYLTFALRFLAQVYSEEDRQTDSWKCVEEANRLTSVEARKIPGMAPIGNSLDSMSEVMKKMGGPPPNGSLGRARRAATRGSMRTVQISAESYYADFKHYPVKLDLAFKSYFPGGQYKIKEGTPPNNVVDGKPTWPVILPTGTSLPAQKAIPGAIVYTFSSNAKTYSIFGLDDKGNYILDDKSGKTLQLSNN